ncbi:NAD(P)-dependent oxidoreductase [Nocardiopsis ansamitocini]|uniref:D-3-phosphoglycerate dehydrogenase n=1 Tax=Nocardiopsis ansamitocini TaxID=1670832 RepID=A0A9W6UIK1_9ACTN|nr:NAD(P)-dependent oxidoreductase [Nocardiopsis ansamitocini]GLU47794.1 hypothetical protein Nans01_21450 [Nocardiopsis ansamitocini]
MPDPRVVITDTGSFDPEPALKLLGDAGFQTRVLGTRDPKRIAAEASDAIALIVNETRVDAELLDALPGLRLVMAMRPGSSRIDMVEAERRGLWVSELPRRENVEQAANRALALALVQLRRIAHHRETSFAPPPRARDLTLGLVGMGQVATRLADCAAPLFKQVIGTGSRLRQWPRGVGRTGFRELLRTADVISLHVPLTPGTKSLIGAPALAAMRPGTVLINLSSPGLVDRRALLTALDTHHLAGYSAGYALEDDRTHFTTRCALRNHPAVRFAPDNADQCQDRLAVLARNIVTWRDRGFPVATVARTGPFFPDAARSD